MKTVFLLPIIPVGGSSSCFAALYGITDGTGTMKTGFRQPDSGSVKIPVAFIPQDAYVIDAQSQPDDHNYNSDDDHDQKGPGIISPAGITGTEREHQNTNQPDQWNGKKKRVADIPPGRDQPVLVIIVLHTKGPLAE